MQTIFTTHSLEIMKHVYNKQWNGVKINFLEISKGLVVNNIDPQIEYIEHKIRAEARIKSKIEKKQILCEDEAAAMWIKGLLARTEFANKFEINFKNMNNGCIKQIAEAKLKCFDDFIFVLDGDCKDKPNFKNSKNIIFLPGRFSPEKNMFNYLRSLPDDDFWVNENLFDYNACFNNYLEDSINTDRCKNWYNQHKQNLGQNCIKFFTHWKKNNQTELENFRTQIKQKL